MPISSLDSIENITFDLIFKTVLWWRILYGSFKILLGITLINFVGTSFYEIFRAIMSHEIIEDPTDLLIRVVSFFLQHSPQTITYFVSVYLIFWGFIEIFLSINLLREKLWAFPTSIITIGLFVVYEVYRVTHTHSLILLVIIIIDIVIVYIIYREYVRLKKERLLIE